MIDLSVNRALGKPQRFHGIDVDEVEIAQPASFICPQQILHHFLRSIFYLKIT